MKFTTALALSFVLVGTATTTAASIDSGDLQVA